MAENRLTSRQIVRLADVISSDSMKKIARDYMKIGIEDIIATKDENRGNREAFVRDLLRKWISRSSTSDNVKELAALLYRAADNKIELNPEKLEEILGVSRDEAKSSLETLHEKSSVRTLGTRDMVEPPIVPHTGVYKIDIHDAAHKRLFKDGRQADRIMLKSIDNCVTF